MLIEVVLQLFIGHIYTQLLKTVDLKILKAGDVQQANHWR